jgi:hypothetical protein
MNGRLPPSDMNEAQPTQAMDANQFVQGLKEFVGASVIDAMDGDKVVQQLDEFVGTSVIHAMDGHQAEKSHLIEPEGFSIGLVFFLTSMLTNKGRINTELNSSIVRLRMKSQR